MLFGGAPAEELTSELERFGATTRAVRTPYTFLLVDTGANRVLVDLGAGALAPTTGELAANLQGAGYGPDRIDHIVITHAHPDHVGGALDANGHLRFPKSTYFFWRREWEYWFSEEAAKVSWGAHDFTAIARKNLSPMESRVTLVAQHFPPWPSLGRVSSARRGWRAGVIPFEIRFAAWR